MEPGLAATGFSGVLSANTGDITRPVNDLFVAVEKRAM